MNTTPNRRKITRVTFTRGFDVQIVAIDGLWRRPCMMLDASETGARLALGETIQMLKAREFFLLLSWTGAAFRRCELAWIHGAEIGVRFLKEPQTSKPAPLARATVLVEI
jgi:hypothetical protein